VIHERFEVERVATADATLVSLVPTQLTRLLDAGAELGRFRVILLGGAAASPSLLERAREAGAHVVPTYGMSETAGGCVYDGLPLDGVEVRIADGGRIAVRGPMLMRGYRVRPDLDRAAFDAGWLLTSDIGSLDSAGRLAVFGRADDVVVTGGVNVAPDQVAALVAGHPDVADVAVTGVDDQEWGQLVVAVVVARVGRTPPTLPRLREWCGDQLSSVALPRAIVVVDQIPRTRSGKLDRNALRGLACDGLGDTRRQ
jgi:o-succinylbenzoate---CoA ligase